MSRSSGARDDAALVAFQLGHGLASLRSWSSCSTRRSPGSCNLVRPGRFCGGNGAPRPALRHAKLASPSWPPPLASALRRRTRRRGRSVISCGCRRSEAAALRRFRCSGLPCGRLGTAGLRGAAEHRASGALSSGGVPPPRCWRVPAGFLHGVRTSGAQRGAPALPRGGCGGSRSRRLPGAGQRDESGAARTARLFHALGAGPRDAARLHRPLSKPWSSAVCFRIAVRRAPGYACLSPACIRQGIQRWFRCGPMPRRIERSWLACFGLCSALLSGSHRDCVWPQLSKGSFFCCGSHAATCLARVIEVDKLLV